MVSVFLNQDFSRAAATLPMRFGLSRRSSGARARVSARKEVEPTALVAARLGGARSLHRAARCEPSQP
jgi:hypothetical protein